MKFGRDRYGPLPIPLDQYQSEPTKPPTDIAQPPSAESDPEPRFTLDEARAEIARQDCSWLGHRWADLATPEGFLTRICDRCGTRRHLIGEEDMKELAWWRTAFATRVCPCHPLPKVGSATIMGHRFHLVTDGDMERLGNHWDQCACSDPIQYANHRAAPE